MNAICPNAYRRNEKTESLNLPVHIQNGGVNGNLKKPELLADILHKLRTLVSIFQLFLGTDLGQEGRSLSKLILGEIPPIRKGMTRKSALVTRVRRVRVSIHDEPGIVAQLHNQMID